MTTYADKVQKSVSRMKSDADAKRLVWLLERGIAFDGSKYMSESEFDVALKGKRRKLSYLAVGDFVKNTDMVKIVPVEAPKNYTADITLRKGKSSDASLPVLVKRTAIEVDYPYLTRELAEKIDRSTNFVARAVRVLNLFGNSKYHQSIRSSKSGEIHRYSEAAKQRLAGHLAKEPGFNPYAA